MQEITRLEITKNRFDPQYVLVLNSEMAVGP